MKGEVGTTRCPRCGKDNLQGSTFCRFCGRKLPAPRPDPPERRRPAAGGKGTAPKGGRRRIRPGRVAAVVGSALVVTVVAWVGVETYRAWKTLPSVNSMVNLNQTGQDSVVYDRYGDPVATLHGSVNRVDVPLSQISPNMQSALIAIEDHNFYSNPGFDVRSILRAALVDLIHHQALQGASTITEQLAKDLYLSDKRTLTRKLQEFIIGLELARIYSKQQILDMYLNDVYLGDGATGVYEASHAYFNESPAKLTLAQASLLAGLPQAPSLYDPLVNLRLAKARQKQVLAAMVRYGDITEAQAAAAYRAPLHLTRGQTVTASASNGQMYPYPWYIDQVIEVLRTRGFSMNQIVNGGLKIYTALDPAVYTIAQQAVDEQMNRLFGASSAAVPNHQAAVVVEDPQNGDILAVIGGRTHVGAFPLDYATAPSVQRSTGSSIKPLIDYTPALVKGYTQMSVIQDVPIFRNVDGEPWWPQNDNHVYHGYMDFRNALAISDNDVAVHVLNDIGLHYGWSFAKYRFGLPLTRSDLQLGAAIGGLKRGLNVFEMTQAYAAFPNGGVRMRPIYVTRVVNQYGAVVYQRVPQGTTEFSPQVAYVMTKMMERVLSPSPIPGIGPGNLATGYQLGLGRPAAGKTGTNNGEEDAWFMGYEPQLVVGVWEGDKNGEIPQTTTAGPAYGATAAGPIWRQIMLGADQALKLPPSHFPRPSGLVFLNHVSATSGELASPYTPKWAIQGAWFVRGTQPTKVGDNHYPVKVPVNHPNELWEPGCGPYFTEIVLRRESDWHPGVPYPWDSRYWPPSQTCRAGAGAGGGGNGAGTNPAPAAGPAHQGGRAGAGAQPAAGPAGNTPPGLGGALPPGQAKRKGPPGLGR